MFLRPYLPSLQNIRALAGLAVKLDQAWAPHGPDMVPIVDTPLTCLIDLVELFLKISEL